MIACIHLVLYYPSSRVSILLVVSSCFTYLFQEAFAASIATVQVAQRAANVAVTAHHAAKIGARVDVGRKVRLALFPIGTHQLFDV